MNLLLVTGRFPQRSETFIYRKVVALAKRGHHVTVATRGAGDWSLYPDARPETLQIIELPPDHTLRDPRRAWAALQAGLRLTARHARAARALYQRCRIDERTRMDPNRMFLRHLPFVALDADVVHFEFLSLGAMYPLVATVLDAPIVVSCRGRDVHTLELQPPAERAAAIACLQQASAIHCVSSEMAGEVQRLTGRSDGLWVNRPAVDTDVITPSKDRASAGPLRLVATGRLVWKKGFDYLLTALARCAARGIDFHAEILGDGELKKSLRFAIEDLGLADKVSLVGAVSSAEVLERMRAADVFVLSSLEEGISNAVLEAMASGLPIVTTTAGGMAEAVTDGCEGFVVPVRDADALAAAIAALAHDPQLRVSMGRAARERAELEFSITRQVETFEALYRSITS